MSEYEAAVDFSSDGYAQTPYGSQTAYPQHVVRSELQGMTNHSLSNIIRQLSSLSQHAEDTFHELITETKLIEEKCNKLMMRVQQVHFRLAAVDSSVDNVPLRGIMYRKPYMSHAGNSGVDQQLMTERSRPWSISCAYKHCDAPPPLGLLTPFREDHKDALKFYTDPSFFFELWSVGMTRDIEHNRARLATTDPTAKDKKKRKKRSRKMGEADDARQIEIVHASHVGSRSNTLTRHQSVDNPITHPHQPPTTAPVYSHQLSAPVTTNGGGGAMVNGGAAAFSKQSNKIDEALASLESTQAQLEALTNRGDIDPLNYHTNSIRYRTSSQEGDELTAPGGYPLSPRSAHSSIAASHGYSHQTSSVGCVDSASQQHAVLSNASQQPHQQQTLPSYPVSQRQLDQEQWDPYRTPASLHIRPSHQPPRLQPNQFVQPSSSTDAYVLQSPDYVNDPVINSYASYTPALTSDTPAALFAQSQHLQYHPAANATAQHHQQMIKQQWQQQQQQRDSSQYQRTGPMPNHQQHSNQPSLVGGVVQLQDQIQQPPQPQQHSKTQSQQPQPAGYLLPNGTLAHVTPHAQQHQVLKKGTYQLQNGDMGGGGAYGDHHQPVNMYQPPTSIPESYNYDDEFVDMDPAKGLGLINGDLETDSAVSNRKASVRSNDSFPFADDAAADSNSPSLRSSDYIRQHQQAQTVVNGGATAIPQPQSSQPLESHLAPLSISSSQPEQSDPSAAPSQQLLPRDPIYRMADRLSTIYESYHSNETEEDSTGRASLVGADRNSALIPPPPPLSGALTSQNHNLLPSSSAERLHTSSRLSAELPPPPPPIFEAGAHPDDPPISSSTSAVPPAPPPPTDVPLPPPMPPTLNIVKRNLIPKNESAPSLQNHNGAGEKQRLGAAEDDRSDLLSAIRRGVPLKKVDLPKMSSATAIPRRDPLARRPSAPPAMMHFPQQIAAKRESEKSLVEERRPSLMVDVQSIMDRAFEMRRRAVEDSDSDSNDDGASNITTGDWSD